VVCLLEQVGLARKATIGLDWPIASLRWAKSSARIVGSCGWLYAGFVIAQLSSARREKVSLGNLHTKTGGRHMVSLKREISPGRP